MVMRLQIVPRASLVSLIVLLAVACSESAENQPPRVPVPAGFIEASGLSDSLRAMGTTGLNPSARLIGLYHTTNAVADILNKGYTVPTSFCKAVMQREYGSVSDAEKGFRTLVENAKKEGSRRFDPNDKEIKAILKRYEDAARNLVPGVSVKAMGASTLGTIVDDETCYAVSLLLNFNWSDGQSQADMPFSVGLAFVRLGAHQVQLSVLCPFQDSSSVTTANEKLTVWLKQVREQNKGK